jgi:hypothetical protein
MERDLQLKFAEGFFWKIHRLKSMARGELTYRARQAIQGRLEQIGIGLARPVEDFGTCGAPWVARLPHDFDLNRYGQAADAVLEGRFDVLSLSSAQLGFPPRWNVDPKSGKVAPHSFGKAIDYRDERQVGNIKYLWELNRHLQAVTLAQAWHLTRQEKYALGCRQLLESWIEQCPYPFGPNWTSSLELAIRLTNWAFAWQLLGGDRSPLFEGGQGHRFRRRWLRSVHEHCHFVANYLSRFSSANNHLLGELMGLFVGALTWPLWPKSVEWLEAARIGFEHEILLQNTPDGVNREQAIYYQHEVMDMMLVCGLLGRENGVDVGRAVWERLQRMMDFIASVMDRGGNVPMIGDSDDAVILRLSQQKGWNPYRSLLATGSILFSRADWKAKAGYLDDKTRWLLGDDAVHRFQTLQSTDIPSRRRAFPDGGYYVLGTRFGEREEVLAVVDCGPLGYLSIAAHGHADALSFTLSAGGVQLLVDPGTYAYHTQRKWRDYFRSTFAHNTVCVDGANQSVIGGNFLWLNRARARCKTARLDDVIQEFEGEHDGYRRFADPVIHRRRVLFNARTNEFRIEDELECRGSHRAEVCWHFSEHCQLTVQGASIRAEVGTTRLLLAAECGEPPARVVSGQDDPPAGWISRAFDVKLPVSTVVWAVPVRETTRFATIIKIDFV